MIDITTPELIDGAIVLETGRLDQELIEYLRGRRLILKTGTWCGIEFAFISDELTAVLTRKAIVQIIGLGNIQNVLPAVSIMVFKATIRNWNLDISKLSLLGLKPKYLILDQCSIEHMNIGRTGDNAYSILAVDTRIQLLQATMSNFQFAAFFHNPIGLAIGAIIHWGGDAPAKAGTNVDFDISNVDVQGIYTDATRVSMNDLHGLMTIIHPQPTEANFYLKSVSFHFDLTGMQSSLMWKSGAKASVSWWRTYFSNPAKATDPRWQRLDLSLAENAALAESTIKALYQRSSLIVSNEDYVRYLYYLNSRPSKLRRLAYWFNGAYYNVKIPFISTFLFLIGMACALVSGNRPVSEMFMAIDPKHLIGSYLLSDISFAHPIAVSKYIFTVCLLSLYYSLFCLGLAIKRKFGFPNELQ